MDRLIVSDASQDGVSIADAAAVNGNAAPGDPKQLQHSRVRGDDGYGRLVGTSAPMRALYDAIERIAPTLATVVICGESGTGKDLVAATLHQRSRRGDGPFLSLNCGALSSGLVESELFGHEVGSFTGAIRRHSGYFERAAGGTLLLDSIEDMPPDVQVKLLRVLETGVVTPIGAQGPIPVDVRVFVATRHPLEASVRDGRLRADLMYRLQVCPLRVPPLRERLDDIPLLAANHLARLNHGWGTGKHLAPSAIDGLRSYHWPGNVRQLQNVIERGFVMSEAPMIKWIPLHERQMTADAGDPDVIVVDVGTTLADLREKFIMSTIRRCSTRERAARVLGVSVKTIYNRLREYR
jgi:DNA-binding NtrC family response regulator